MRTRMTALWLRLRAAAGGPGRFSAAWVTLTGTGAAASVAFGLLVFASVLASLAIPRESAGLSTAALQRVIAASQPADRTVVGTVPETSMTDEIGEVQAADIAAVGASLRARLTAGGLVVASDPPAWAGLTTEYVPVSGAARAAGDGPPQFEMTYRTELTRYSQIVAGQLPVTGSEPGKQAVVQAAVTTATAARFGLKVGTRLNAGQVQLVITGIIRPTNPAATFWTQEPVAARPTLTPAAAPQLPYWLGAAFVGPGALPLIEANIGAGEMQVAWAYAAALGGLTAGQASGFEASVSSLVSSGATVTDRAGNPVTATISSQIPAILAPFTSGESAVAPVLELLYVSLTVIGAIVVLLGARLVAQRRAAEFTLMRARGAALYQLAWLVLRASVVIAAAAGALAAVLAIGLTPGDGDALGWWLAGLTIAVTLAGPVLISVVPQRVAAPVTGRTGGAVRRAPGRGPAARRIIVEIALVALAIGGLVVLRNEGPSSGNNGLYAGAAPVLILTARGRPDDRIEGLKLGADDYLAKPFDPEELVLRVEAILRRAAQAPPAARQIKLGRCVFDTARGELQADGVAVRLTESEAHLLRVLARAAHAAVDRLELAGANTDAGGRAVDIQVTRLRRKIEDDPANPRYLRTVRGRGYMLTPD